MHGQRGLDGKTISMKYYSAFFSCDYQVINYCWMLCCGYHVDGLVQDCSISIPNALEILQPCTKPLIYYLIHVICLFIYFRVASLALGQSCDCSSTSEINVTYVLK